MNEYQIREALNEFITNANVDPDSRLFKQAALAVDALDSFKLVDKRTSIAIDWFIEDVQSVREDLTDEQALVVLRAVEDRHNAEIGINWDYIEAVADDIYPEGE